MGDRKKLTVTEAEAMLAPGDYVHTFIGGNSLLLGADWKRTEILAAFNEHGAELSGKIATSMDHSVCFHDGHHWVFVATKPA